MAKVAFDIAKVLGWVKGSNHKALQVMKEATAEAAARVIERTPVDTGFARANWFPVVNGRQAAGGTGAVVASVSFSGVQVGDRIGVVNNVEYIRALEYGHSQQAPQGMVRVTVAQWPAIVREVAAKVAGNV